MDFHYRIQEESIILCSMMRMGQRSCADTPGLSHRVPSKGEFQNEDQGLETWLRG